MKEKVIRVLKSPMTYIILAAIGVRIFLGYEIGNWLPPLQHCDDELLISYAFLRSHFHAPNSLSLVKYMGYPLYLLAVRFSHIPYSVVTSLLYVTAAFFAIGVFRKLGAKKIISYGAFFYILFIPMAFELWTGTRLYRNGIIAPFTAITISSMILLLIEIARERRKGHLVADSILLALSFTFTYYIKEDGIWLLACLLFTILLGLLWIVFKKMGTRKIFSTVFLVVPLVAFLLGTQVYKGINYHYFGVYAVETKNTGEMADFAALLYKIETPKRDIIHWAPKDSFEIAMTHSDTLASEKGFCDQLCEFYDTLGPTDNPANGDLITWAIRSSAWISGLWENETQMQEFFGKVNAELNNAVKKKEILLTDRISLLSSAGSYTWEEILSLSDDILAGYQGSVLLKGYTMGITPISDEAIADDYNTMECGVRLTNENYLTDYSRLPSLHEEATAFSRVLRIIYSVINSVLFVGSWALIIYALIRLCREKKRKEALQIDSLFYISAAASLVFHGIALLYSFAISWFSAFIYREGINMTIVNFYHIAMPILLFFAYTFAATAIGTIKKKSK